MHVIIVSACEKRAIKRTRAVVDSFALRTGPRTWATPITEEGLRELRRGLKRVATRQTAVACYRNDGRRAMKLLWVVGSRRKFGETGHFPAGYMTGVRRRRPLAPWVPVTALLTQSAGLAHDWGKAVRFFQTKLREEKGVPMKDPVRHEWLSLKLLQAVRNGNDPAEVWRSLAVSSRLREEKPEWFKGIYRWEHVLEYLVSSHHKLFAEDGGNVLGVGLHVRNRDENVRPVTQEDLLPRSPIPEAPLRKLEANLARLAKRPETQTTDPYFWRGVATIARVCLVLADHYVSSLPRASDDRTEDGLYANTHQRKLKQSLDWHLQEVGRVAGDLVYRVAELEMAGLSEDSVDAVLRPSDDARFTWQDEAVRVLAHATEERRLPTLAINLAGTGAGKTRMNAKAICALSGDRPVRFVTALNLRTLTLQTGDVYRHEIGIGADELACVIGDRVVKKLHEYGKAADGVSYAVDGPEDADGNTAFDYELDVYGDAYDLPAWLEPLVAKQLGAAKMLAPPVLVSTVDTVIKAGEPHYQGHHAVQFLRLAGSDLVLDELDGYDPDALVAVLRLVTVAGLFGRNVVASSATLPKPVVRALVEAYRLGLRMHAALEGGERHEFRCAFIDNVVSPLVLQYRSDNEALVETVERDFEHRVKSLSLALQGQRLKVPMIQAVEENGETALFEAAAAAASQLHRNTAWTFGRSGKRVSFGLVRCANIGTAIPMARWLALALPQARVACYHSQDLLIQRYHKERRLDALLNRKEGDRHILEDEEIRSIVENAAHEETLFIVVATPVEEVGRDHDFDWAVIEPSSTHSIVQTAGRVNRHRLQPVTAPNVAILRFNARYLRGAGKGRVFIRPGLERSDSPYPSHDLKELLDWAQMDNLDARVRYDSRHPFAMADDHALQGLLAHPSNPFVRFLSTTNALWAGVQTYESARLRDYRERQRISVDETGNVYRQEADNNRDGGMRWIAIDLGRDSPVPRAANDWLTLSLGEMVDLAHETDVPWETALSLTMPVPYRDRDGNLAQSICWDSSFGWSYRTQ